MVGKYYAGDLYLANSSIKELPEGLHVRGHLDLTGSSVEKLPKRLLVGGDLFLRGTKIKELPKSLGVRGKMFLDGSAIENYPLVRNCGIHGRTIYLDLRDKSIIHIGCFKGTMEEALEAVKYKYGFVFDHFNNEVRVNDKYIEYCNQVKKCFKLEEGK